MSRSPFGPAIVGVALVCALAAPAHAAEITVLSGNGARAAITERCAQFERATGHEVALRFEVNPETQRKIEEGEAFDVAILNPPVLDALIRQGKVIAGTRTVIGRSGIGVAAISSSWWPRGFQVCLESNSSGGSLRSCRPGSGLPRESALPPWNPRRRVLCCDS